MEGDFRYGTTATLPPAAGVDAGEVVERHWNLVSHPFGFAPDPAFAYETDAYREALARLLYNVVELRAGLSVVVGGPGVGKTTLARAFLRELPRGRYRPALLVNPPLPASVLLGAVLEELGERAPRRKADRVDAFVALVQRFAERGVEPVLVVDEAHALGRAGLEELRRLLNVEGDDRKLFHAVLVGRPELERAARANESLAQRAAVWARLGPLSPDEVARYVEHRLKAAGADARLFEPAALARLAELSGGVPRRVNAIAAGALFAGAAQRARSVGPDLVEAAFEDLEPREELP